jgi:hypothetical protein
MIKTWHDRCDKTWMFAVGLAALIDIPIMKDAWGVNLPTFHLSFGFGAPFAPAPFHFLALSCLSFDIAGLDGDLVNTYMAGDKWGSYGAEPKAVVPSLNKSSQNFVRRFGSWRVYSPRVPHTLHQPKSGGRKKKRRIENCIWNLVRYWYWKTAKSISICCLNRIEYHLIKDSTKSGYHVLTL